MIKVISFSLWGNIKTYNIGCIKNVIIAKYLFPDWEVWIYYNNETTPKCIIEWLSRQTNVRLHSIKDNNVANTFKTSGQQGSMWRYYPLDCRDVDVLVCRDTDSRLSYYELVEIEKWLSTPVKSDNPGIDILSMIDGYEKAPPSNKLLRAGTCAFRMNNSHETDIQIIETIKEVFNSNAKLPFYCDETFLHHFIKKYKLSKSISFIPRGVKDKIHVDKTCELFTTFVGDVLDEYNRKVDKNKNNNWQNRRLSDDDDIEQYIVNDYAILENFLKN